jgi:hypothetical protein
MRAWLLESGVPGSMCSTAKIVAYGDAVSGGQKLLDFTAGEITAISKAFGRPETRAVVSLRVSKAPKPSISSRSGTDAGPVPSPSAGEHSDGEIVETRTSPATQREEPKVGPEVGRAAEPVASPGDEAADLATDMYRLHRASLDVVAEAQRAEPPEWKEPEPRPEPRDLTDQYVERPAPVAPPRPAPKPPVVIPVQVQRTDAIPKPQPKPMKQGGSVAYPKEPAQPASVPSGRGPVALLVLALLLGTVPVSLRVLAPRIHVPMLTALVTVVTLTDVLLFTALGSISLVAAAWMVLLSEPRRAGVPTY